MMGSASYRALDAEVAARHHDGVGLLEESKQIAADHRDSIDSLGHQDGPVGPGDRPNRVEIVRGADGAGTAEQQEGAPGAGDEWARRQQDAAFAGHFAQPGAVGVGDLLHFIEGLQVSG